MVKNPWINITPPLPGPKSQAVLAQDRKYVSPSYSRPYPLVAAKAEGMVVTDMDGNTFLDFAAGIAVCATGHCHPRIVKVIQDQAAQLIHLSGTDFYYPQLSALAQKLAEIAPGRWDKKVYFGNSGTEAIEAALKLARYATGRKKFIAFYGAFHGRTLGALSLTASKPVQRRGFGPLLEGITHIPYPYCYRCPNRPSAGGCDPACLRVIEDQLFKTVLSPDEVAAIVFEPIQGEGGYIVPPAEFFEELKRISKRHGILLVADEVQSGMGRTGKMFAVEHFGVEPDIIAVAKGIASGLPLGAIVARAELMSWPPGSHASTFGGNPISCVAALETIRLIETELMQNAGKVGDHLMQSLLKLKSHSSVIGDVRGLGLMIGIEFVKDQATKEKAGAWRDLTVQRCFERGLLVLGCGENTLRLMPPLIVSRAQADAALEILEDALSTIPGK